MHYPLLVTFICIFSGACIFAAPIVKLKGVGSHIEELSTKTRYVKLHLGGRHSNFNSRILPRTVRSYHQSEIDSAKVEEQLGTESRVGEVAEAERNHEKGYQPLEEWFKSKDKLDEVTAKYNLLTKNLQKIGPGKVRQLQRAQKELDAAKAALTASKAQPDSAEAVQLTQAREAALKAVNKKTAKVKQLEAEIQSHKDFQDELDKELKAAEDELNTKQSELSEANKLVEQRD